MQPRLAGADQHHEKGAGRRLSLRRPRL